MSEIIVSRATTALLMLLVGVFAVMPAFQRRRLGWFGVPLGVALATSAMFQFLGSLSGFLDLLPLAFGAAAAGLMGWRLPMPDSAFAVLAGPVMVIVLGYALGTSGADNPLPILIAACGLAFMVGGGASAIVACVRARRARRPLAHG